METQLSNTEKNSKEQAYKAQLREKKTGTLISETIINDFNKRRGTTANL